MVYPTVAFAWVMYPFGNPAAIPHDRLDEQWWQRRHDHCVRMSTYGRADVAFLGDSITQNWEYDGEHVWDTQIAPLKAANFGFGGDRTEHVLWRLDHGELISMHPKVVVVMIGTNNIGQGATPDETAEGVRTIVKTLTEKLPKSKVLLLGIFPRGMTPDDPGRRKTVEATALFKGVADGKRVRFMDLGGVFTHPDGTLRSTMLPDLLHPNAAGYEIWAQAVLPEIRAMLRA